MFKKQKIAKMQKIIYLIFLLFFLTAANFVFADNNSSKLESEKLKVTISVKDSFKENELITYDYKIISLVNQSLSFMPSMECKNGDIPIPLPQDIQAKMKKGEIYSGKFSGVQVIPEFPEQSCQAVITFREPSDVSFRKEFYLATKPKIDLHLLVCKDETCGEESKNATVNVPIFLSYNDRQHFPAVVIIKKDEKEINTIKLPAWHKFSESGTYLLEFSFNTVGFQPIKEVKAFKVSGQATELICNNDNKCTDQENSQNCPQDCSAKKKVLSAKIIILIAAVAMVIGVIIAAYYFLARRREI